MTRILQLHNICTPAPLRDKFLQALAIGVPLMHRHRSAAFLTALTLVALLLSHAASAQLKATAPEKMMPSDKVQKMRECQKQAEQQKIKMEDRSRFVNECVATGPK